MTRGILSVRKSGYSRGNNFVNRRAELEGGKAFNQSPFVRSYKLGRFTCNEELR